MRVTMMAGSVMMFFRLDRALVVRLVCARGLADRVPRATLACKARDGAAPAASRTAPPLRRRLGGQ